MLGQSIWVIAIGISCGLASCGLSGVQSPPSNVRMPSPQPSVVLPSPASQVVPNRQAAQPKQNQELAGQDELAEQGGIQQQDYAPTMPLPETGRVTIRDHIQNLDANRLITECPADSAPYAFAESTHYRVQICSAEYDPWMPKYYMGQAKDGSGELRITSSDPAEARQLIFKSEGYTYILYRDAARPEQVNAYLQVFTPNGDSYAEALLYFYEAAMPQTKGAEK